MKPLWLSVCCCLSLLSCHSPGSMTSHPILPQSASDQDTAFQIEGQTLSTDQIQAFLIQKLRQNGGPSVSPKAAWHQNQPSGLQRTPELRIESIRLADTGQSILGANAPFALVPALQGKSIELVLTGRFATKQDKTLKLKNFLFTLEPPLLHQSLAPGTTEPSSRVLLDDAILLTPKSVSETEIRVSLNTRGLLDLLLAGTHKLAVIHNRYYTDALVKVARAEVEPGNLQPRIHTVEVIRNQQNEPRFLKCVIDNAMTQPKFAYATLDGVFGFGYQTQVIEGESELSWEVLIHIPDPTTFNAAAAHTLTYTTPFGTAYRQF